MERKELHMCRIARTSRHAQRLGLGLSTPQNVAERNMTCFTPGRWQQAVCASLSFLPRHEWQRAHTGPQNQGRNMSSFEGIF